jgi:hypothetical protein
MLIANISLLLVLSWLKKYSLLIDGNVEKHFVVVIPVLREQKVIGGTIRHFLGADYPKDKLTLLIVTTEREFSEGKQRDDVGETTMKVVEKLKQEMKVLYGRDVVQSIHYPDAQGKMVDQLNYAFDFILKYFPAKRDELFVAVYNADSRPNQKTFSCISNLSKLNGGRVFQQSALFFDNWHKIEKERNFLEAKYLQANATLQSRWTLAHEMPRFFRQSYFLRRWGKRIFLSHCVGHGLFLRGDLIESVRKMPTGTVTEDLFFGYILSLLGEPIQPVPVMEMAESPSTLKEALKQKYVWFFGPLDHFHYARYFAAHYPNKANSFLRKWFSFQGVAPAFIWAVQGWIFLYLFLYPVMSGQWYLLWFSSGVFLLYGPLSYGIMLRDYSFLACMCSKRDA